MGLGKGPGITPNDTAEKDMEEILTKTPWMKRATKFKATSDVKQNKVMQHRFPSKC